MRLIDANEFEIELTKQKAHLMDKACHTTIESDRMMYVNTATGLLHAINILHNAPTVELFCSYLSDGEVRQPCVEAPCEHERPQGEWIKIFENPFTNGYICPFCGHKIQVTEQFLPKVTECESCGAKMKGGAE